MILAREKSEVLGKEPFPATLRLSQISPGLYLGLNGLRNVKLATSCGSNSRYVITI
jgi:hypothetical protein